MSQSQTESAIYSSRHYIHQHTLRRYLLAWFEPLYQISIFPYGPLPNQVRVITYILVIVLLYARDTIDSPAQRAQVSQGPLILTVASGTTR